MARGLLVLWLQFLPTITGDFHMANRNQNYQSGRDPSGRDHRGRDEGRYSSAEDERDYGSYTESDEGDSSVRAGAYDQGRERYGRDTNDQRGSTGRFAGYGNFGQGDYGGGRGGEYGQDRHGQNAWGQQRNQGGDFQGGNYGGGTSGRGNYGQSRFSEGDFGQGGNYGPGSSYGQGNQGQGGNFGPSGYGQGDSSWQSGSRSGYGRQGSGRGFSGYGYEGYGYEGSGSRGGQQSNYGQQSGYGSSGGWSEPYGEGQQYSSAGLSGGRSQGSWGGSQSGGSQGYWGGQSGGSQSNQSGQWGQDANRGMGQHRGKGPKGYQRSDDRIKELICERLRDDPEIDPSEVTITVQGGKVTLEGTVDSRQAKNSIEDIAEQFGVQEVQNNLRVQRATSTGSQTGDGGRSATGKSGTEDGEKATKNRH
jgi:osmotically-inducible protein OsmY